MIAIAKQWISRHEVRIAKAIIGLGILTGVILIAISGAMLVFLALVLAACAVLGAAFLLVWSLIVLSDHHDGNK